MRYLRVATLTMAVAALPLAADPPVPAGSHAPAVATASLATRPGTLATVLSSYYTPAEMQAGVYVGAEYCIACHQSYAGWRDTRHAKAYRRPMTQYKMMDGKGVVNDVDKNGKDDFEDGLDFNTISSAFDAYKPNAPKLSVVDGTYTVQIGELKMVVLYTHGGTGEWKQRYVLKVPLAGGGWSSDAYTSPIQWNENSKTYNAYNPGYWYDATTKLPLFGPSVTAADLGAKNGGTQSKKCVGCHTTGIRELKKLATGEYQYRPYVASLYRADDPSYLDFDGDGNYDILNVACEACHGPGSNHVLGGGDPAKIVNPKKLTPEKANEVCAQCHIRVLSVPAGTHEWPYKDDTHTSFVPGGTEPLTSFYKDAGGYWPDAKSSKQHHQQWPDLKKSGKADYQFHKVLCSECHDPHKPTGNKYQVVAVSDQGTVQVPTKDENNTLCLACHATHGPFATLTKAEVAAYEANKDKIANVVSAHSHHPYGPDRSMGLSRCSTCHMPRVAGSAASTSLYPYDIASHTFEPIAPEKTLTYQTAGGMPNSCAVSCHGTKVNSFQLGLDPGPFTWNQPFDVSLATELKKWFGPGGTWWNTTHTTSMTNRALQSAPKPEDAKRVDEFTVSD